MLESKDFTHGGLYSSLIKLALPIMGTSFMQMAYSFTDMAYLGRLGTDEVASVGVCSVFVWIASSASLMGKVGAEVLLGQSIGRKESKAEQAILCGNNLSLSLLLGLLIAFSYFFFSSRLVGIYDLVSTNHSRACSYLEIVSLGLPAVFVTASFFGIYNAIGHSKIPFRLLGIGLLVNMLLDPLFIFAFDLGVEGSACATLLSELVVLVLFLWRAYGRDRLFGGLRWFHHLRLSELSRIFSSGGPVAALNILFAFVSVYLGRLASQAGGAIGVATLTTGGQIEALTWNTAQGITTALSTIVAQNYTAGLRERVFAVFRAALSMTIVVGALGTIVFVLWGESLFALIVPDANTALSGGVYLKISGYSQVFMMTEITAQGLLYGLGRSYAPAAISILGNYLRIPLAIFLIDAMLLGLSGIWWAITISTILKGIMAIMYVLLLRNKILYNTYERKR